MANVKYGRRARWLNIVEIFLDYKGRPIAKNQELILRLLLDEKEVLLDFTCDYSEGSENLELPQGLSEDDPRRYHVCMCIFMCVCVYDMCVYTGASTSFQSSLFCMLTRKGIDPSLFSAAYNEYPEHNNANTQAHTHKHTCARACTHTYAHTILHVQRERGP